MTFGITRAFYIKLNFIVTLVLKTIIYFSKIFDFQNFASLEIQLYSSSSGAYPLNLK